MIRTHLVITILAILLFLPHVSNQFIFIFVALIATALPDIDTGFSTVGKLKVSKAVQFLVKHRGIFHSFTFCVIISVIFAFFIPVLALPFFIGYALHLFADSFTIEGIKPFWPSKKVSSWKLRTGSYAETTLFVLFLVADLLLFIFLFMNIS